MLPIFTRALRSTSAKIVANACRVLNTLGVRSWAEVDRPLWSPPLIIGAELGSAVLRRICESRLLAAAFDADSNNAERLKPEDVQDLFCWLVASIRTEPSLAPMIDESVVMSLFVSELSKFIRAEEVYDCPPNYMWRMVHLFLSRWHATLAVASLSGNQDVEDQICEPALCDDVLRTIVAYAFKGLNHISRDVTNAEMFSFLFTFARRAFSVRPDAALFFGLDLACEMLMETLETWRVVGDGVSADREALAYDRELEMLIVKLAGARRVYARVSRTRDPNMRYAIGTGWWKFGGLGQSCVALCLQE